MTREQAKELLPIIQAYAEGKTIEICNNMEWRDLIIDSPNFDCKPSCYRIKSEPKYRPFKSQEECWNEMLKHQPWGWLKLKKNGSFCCIGEVSWSEAWGKVLIKFSTNETVSLGSDSVFENVTFADGTPFGIKEEQL